MAYPLGNAVYPPPSSAVYPPPSSAMCPPVTGIQAPVMLNSFPGYEGLAPGASGGFLPPPPVQPTPAPAPQPVRDWSIPALTEAAAQEAFRKYVDDHCCWKSDPARDSVITGMTQFNSYRYRLQTFTEFRKTEWATKPYDGHTLTSFGQTPPTPWQIQVDPPEMFKDSVKDVDVPNTSSVKLCDKCSATGSLNCTVCTGSGKKECQACGGSGATPEQRCSHCQGTGKLKCSSCAGQGKKECGTCKGKRQLLSYIKLTVEWKNNSEDFTTEQESGLKKEKLGNVSGKQLYQDAQCTVYPLIGFPDQRVVEVSERMIREHQSKYSQTLRVLQQKQTVELIPITKVSYQWEGKSYFYYVYGTESKVKTDDYPGEGCCTIL